MPKRDPVLWRKKGKREPFNRAALGFPDHAEPLSSATDFLGTTALYGIHGELDSVDIPNFGVTPAFDDDSSGGYGEDF